MQLRHLHSLSIAQLQHLVERVLMPKEYHQHWYRTTPWSEDNVNAYNLNVLLQKTCLSAIIGGLARSRRVAALTNVDLVDKGGSSLVPRER